MSDDRPKRKTVSIEEATIFNTLEIAAVVLLEKKGLCTKHDLHTIIDELRWNPRARLPESLLTAIEAEIETKIIEDIAEMLNKNGLTLHQSQNLLERWGRILGRIIEQGQREAKGTTH